jgi:cystathionine beta-lyase/cystathionine gamma-synthase
MIRESDFTDVIHKGHDFFLESRSFPSPQLWLNSAIPLKGLDEGWSMITGKQPNIVYQRYSNPTVLVLEQKFAHLEGARHSLATNNGMAACLAVLRSLLNPGDHIVSQYSLYAEINDMLQAESKVSGFKLTLVQEYSVNSFRDAINIDTKMIFIEVPTNPSMHDIDIREVSDLCKEKNILLVVDNTMLTPCLLRPLDLGADITLYSTSKHINGHGDALGGIISTQSDQIAKKISSYIAKYGLSLDPFSAWLIIRGLRSLPLRLERHARNAEQVILFLKECYPNIPIHYGSYNSVKRKNGVLMGSGVFSIILPNRSIGVKFVGNLRLITLATTFGNLESTVYNVGGFANPDRDLGAIGIHEGLVRFSIGIENATDIILDIRKALEISFT